MAEEAEESDTYSSQSPISSSCASTKASAALLPNLGRTTTLHNKNRLLYFPSSFTSSGERITFRANISCVGFCVCNQYKCEGMEAEWDMS